MRCNLSHKQALWVKARTMYVMSGFSRCNNNWLKYTNTSIIRNIIVYLVLYSNMIVTK